MLRNAEFPPVTITNAVRCRPPKNRKPVPGEINACRPYLAEEISALQPEAIVALGDTALRSLTGHSGVTKYRGQELALHKSFGVLVPVFCTYHPAYVARVPTHQATVEADLRRIRDRGKPEVEVAWKWAEDAPEGEVVALDIETDWNRETRSGGSNVTQIAYATESGVHVARTLSGVEALQGRTLVTHNGWAYDLPKLREVTGAALQDGDDTMVLAYLDDETQPLGLEALCVKYLGVKGWKEGINAPDGSEEFALYNARDALYTLSLRNHLSGVLGKRKSIADVIIRPAYAGLRACSERGIYIDYEAVLTAEEHFNAQRDYAARFLALHGVENPNSADNISSVLLAEGHVLPATETGKAATGIAVLSSLEQTQLVKGIRAYRKAAKAINGFVRPYVAIALTGDGRAHPTYKLWRTVTGRSSASKPNVQQLARDKMLRAFFAAPPGFEFAQADYAAIEFRLAAFVAGCTPVLERYAEDPQWDPHRWMASIIYRVPERDVTPLQRQIAKSANFGLLYMAQWFTLQEYVLKTTGIRLTENECKVIRWAWHKTFPQFQEWYVRTEHQLTANGYVESLTGRRRHYGDPGFVRSLPVPVREGFLREAVNFQVQSLGADVALMGLGRCHEMELPVNGFFHDANTFEFAYAGTGQALHQIREGMVEYPREALRSIFGIDLTVPLVVEVKTKENKWLI